MLKHKDINNDGKVQFSEISCGRDENSNLFPCEDDTVKKELIKDYGFSDYQKVEGLPAEAFKKYLLAMNQVHLKLYNLSAFGNLSTNEAQLEYVKDLLQLGKTARQYEPQLKLPLGTVPKIIEKNLQADFQSLIDRYYFASLTGNDIAKLKNHIDFTGKLLLKKPDEINAEVSNLHLLEQKGTVLLGLYVQECGYHASRGDAKAFNELKTAIKTVAQNAGLQYPEKQIHQFEWLFLIATNALQDNAHTLEYLKPYLELLNKIKTDPYGFSFEIQPNSFDYERYYISVHKNSNDTRALFSFQVEYDHIGEVFIGGNGVRIEKSSHEEIFDTLNKKIDDSGILAQAWK